MIWWFLILGVSTLVVVCVVIALYLRLRLHLQHGHTLHEGTHEVDQEHHSGTVEH
jgi:hypothetical protein